jgi:hypothetical protein
MKLMVVVMYDREPGPVLSGIKFVNLLNGVTLRFDKPTDYGTMRGTFPCDEAITLSNRMENVLGDLPFCHWLNPYELKTTFGFGATMKPGDKMAASDLFVKVAYEDGFVPSLMNVNTSMVAVYPADEPLEPTVSIRGPVIIGVCDGITVDGSASKGSGGRLLNFTWTFSVVLKDGSGEEVELAEYTATHATNAATLSAAGDYSTEAMEPYELNLEEARAIVAEANMANNGLGQATIKFPASAIPASVTLAVSLEAINFVNRRDIGTHVFTKYDRLIPGAIIDGSKKTTMKFEYMARVNTTLPDTSCLPPALALKSDKMAISWRDASGNYMGGNELSVRNPHILRIPADALVVDTTYRFETSVYMVEAPWMNNTVSVTVTVLPQPLRAMMSRSGLFAIGSEQPFSLDASQSYDPDEIAPGFTYRWACTNSTDGGPCLVTNPHGDDGTGSELMLEPGVQMIVYAGTLAKGLYTFTVTVGVDDGFVGELHDNRTSTASTQVKVVEGAIPSVEVYIGESITKEETFFGPRYYVAPDQEFGQLLSVVRTVEELAALANAGIWPMGSGHAVGEVTSEAYVLTGVKQRRLNSDDMHHLNGSSTLAAQALSSESRALQEENADGIEKQFWKLILADVQSEEVFLSQTRPRATINVGVLTIGATYVFELRAWDYSGGQGYSRVYITVNEPPSSGYFEVEPPKGTAGVTPFDLKAFNWEDENLPLYYVFSQDKDLDAAWVPLGDQNPSNLFFSPMAQGRYAHDFRVGVRCRVLDAFGASTFRDKEAVVIPNPITLKQTSQAFDKSIALAFDLEMPDAALGSTLAAAGALNNAHDEDVFENQCYLAVCGCPSTQLATAEEPPSCKGKDSLILSAACHSNQTTCEGACGGVFCASANSALHGVQEEELSTRRRQLLTSDNVSAAFLDLRRDFLETVQSASSLTDLNTITYDTLFLSLKELLSVPSEVSWDIANASLSFANEMALKAISSTTLLDHIGTEGALGAMSNLLDGKLFYQDEHNFKNGSAYNASVSSGNVTSSVDVGRRLTDVVSHLATARMFGTFDGVIRSAASSHIAFSSQRSEYQYLAGVSLAASSDSTTRVVAPNAPLDLLYLGDADTLDFSATSISVDPYGKVLRIENASSNELTSSVTEVAVQWAGSDTKLASTRARMGDTGPFTVDIQVKEAFDNATVLQGICDAVDPNSNTTKKQVLEFDCPFGTEYALCDPGKFSNSSYWMDYTCTAEKPTCVAWDPITESWETDTCKLARGWGDVSLDRDRFSVQCECALGDVQVGVGRAYVDPFHFSGFTDSPTEMPSYVPTPEPSPRPTNTFEPTPLPSPSPSLEPTVAPSPATDSVAPSPLPTIQSVVPTIFPTEFWGLPEDESTARASANIIMVIGLLGALILGLCVRHFSALAAAKKKQKREPKTQFVVKDDAFVDESSEEEAPDDGAGVRLKKWRDVLAPALRVESVEWVQELQDPAGDAVSSDVRGLYDQLGLELHEPLPAFAKHAKDVKYERSRAAAAAAAGGTAPGGDMNPLQRKAQHYGDRDRPVLRIDRLDSWDSSSDEDNHQEENAKTSLSSFGARSSRDHGELVSQLPPKYPGGPRIRIEHARFSDESSSEDDRDNNGLVGDASGGAGSGDAVTASLLLGRQRSGELINGKWVRDHGDSVSQLPPRFPGGPQLRIERLPKFEGESDSSEEGWEDPQASIASGSNGRALTRSGSSGSLAGSFKDHGRRVHQLPPRVPGGPQIRLDKGDDQSSGSGNSSDEEEDRHARSSDSFVFDKKIGVSSGRRSSSHSNVGSFGRHGSRESGNSQDLMGVVPLGSGRGATRTGSSSRGSSSSSYSLEEVQRGKEHAVKVLPPAYAGGPRLRVDVAKSEHSSDSDSDHHDDHHHGGMVPRAGVPTSGWSRDSGGTLSRSGSGDGWGGVMAAYQTPATAAISSSNAAAPPKATERVESPELADFRSSLQVMVAQQPQVNESRSGAGRRSTTSVDEDHIPMSNTVVTGSGLRFELSDEAKSVIESALDDDFLDSLMDSGNDGGSSNAAASAEGGSAVSASVATFLFDSGLGAYLSAFEGMHDVQAVDDLYHIRDFARLGFSASDTQTLRRALTRRARAEAFQVATGDDDDNNGNGGGNGGGAPAAAASSSSSTNDNQLQRSTSVIENALDDDFLNSLTDDHPAASTSSGPASGTASAVPSAAATQAPGKSVIAAALSDDFLDSLLDEEPSGGQQPSTSAFENGAHDDYSSAPSSSESLTAFLGSAELGHYRAGLSDLGVGSIDELYEVTADELARAPVGMSQGDMQALQAALATRLMPDRN